MKQLKNTEPILPFEKAQAIVAMKAQIKSMQEQVDKYTEELLALTQQQGVLTLKTDAYTISRAKRVTPKVVSFDKLKKSLIEKDIPFQTKEVFDEFMGEVFRKAIADGVELDGLEAQTTEYISIRISK